MFDLLIQNATIVDGTGAEPFLADIAVTDGVIAAVQPSLTGEAPTVIDATDMIVTPGFIDVHTHYDGQVTWDSDLEPSASHGITTSLIGNCGVGFAPVKPDQRDAMMLMMAGVEDIPYSTLQAGVPFAWESFGEYLDFLGARRYTMDVASLLPHAALRTYVMGDRGARNEPANQDDAARMAAVVREAIADGAFGFSTGRVAGHMTLEGAPVPGTYASTEELRAITDAAAEASRQVNLFNASGGSSNPRDANVLLELKLAGDLSRRGEQKFMVPVIQNRTDPLLWRRMLETTAEENQAGARLIGQVADGRPFGRLVGFPVNHPFVLRPTYRALLERGLSPEERTSELLRLEVRTAILSEPDDTSRSPPYVSIEMHDSVAIVLRNLDNLYPLGGEFLDYEPRPDSSVVAIARAQGKDPLEVLYDYCSLENGTQLLLLPFFNYADFDCQALYQQLTTPDTVVGLADGGAHYSVICDASQPTWMLTHWTRDRTRGPRLPLKTIVKRLTGEPAHVLGLADRGVIANGKRADLNVIDYAKLRLLPPHVVADLPAGGRRLVQGADGYRATVVAGVVTRSYDEATGALPGRLVRA